MTQQSLAAPAIVRAAPSVPAVPAVRAARALRDVARRPSAVAAVTALSVCVPPGPAELDQTVQVSAGDVAGVLLAGLAGLLVLAGRAALPRGTAVIFGPLTVALGVTTLWSQDIAASLPGFIRVVQIFVVLPLAVVVVLRDRRDARLVCGAVIVAALAEAGYGLWQAATATGASIGGRTVRAVGTFGALDVLALSTLLGYGIVLTVAFALVARGRARPAALAALAVQAAGLAATLSRGGWIAAGAALLIMLLLFDRRVAIRAAVAAMALAVVLVGGLGVGSQAVTARTRSLVATANAPDQSVSDRYGLWRTALAISRDHPVTGVGVKNFAAFRDGHAPLGLSSASETADGVNGYIRQPLLSPHNQYLLVLSEQGVVGLAGFAAFIAAVLRGLWARRDARDPLWLACTGLMAWLTVNFLYSDLGGPGTVLAALMLGLCSARALPGPLRPAGASG